MRFLSNYFDLLSGVKYFSVTVCCCTHLLTFTKIQGLREAMFFYLEVNLHYFPIPFMPCVCILL